jgi:multiple sugar transport system substrate-binding protein
MPALVRRLAFALALALAALAAPGAALAQTLTLWSHWADHESKVKFVEDAARAFEKKHPGVTVKITWYQKEPLYAALKTALRAGQAPDIFYAEPDQVEYVDNGFLHDLSKGLNWQAVEPWARESWTFGQGVYGFPLEAWTVEMYYNRATAERLGVNVQPGGQLSQAEFLAAVKKAAQAGVTPIVQGVGDRPYPGAFIVHEPLLKKLGKGDYDALLRGKLPWTDPRVVETLGFVKQVVDAGAHPKSFSSLKMGEAHYYFHTQPGGLMFPMGSFYPSRAFNPTDKGGQPPNFPLGIMQFPAIDGGKCNQCKTLTVGGSYAVNAAAKRPDLAVAFLNEMANVEMGNRWMELTLVQTGIKTDPSKIKGQHADYFRMLARANEKVDYYIGLPSQRMTGRVKETFAQVMNSAFPAGLLSVQDAVKQMEAARQSP